MIAAPPTTLSRVEMLVRKAVAFDGPLTPDMRLLDDLGLDSLDAVELVIAAEEEFGLELPDDDVEHLATIGDVVALVDRAIAGR